MGSIWKPSMRASGRVLATRASMSAAARSTAAGSARLSATPPTSVLCWMSGERILSATG
jgi:hypothetical protein